MKLYLRGLLVNLRVLILFILFLSIVWYFWNMVGGGVLFCRGFWFFEFFFFFLKLGGGMFLIFNNLDKLYDLLLVFCLFRVFFCKLVFKDFFFFSIVLGIK